MSKQLPIDEKTETKIRELARNNGYKDTPLLSNGTHQIELQKRINDVDEYIYISRFTGVSKGQLQIVIKPDLDDVVNNKLLMTDEISSAESGGRKGKDVQSSQYKGFQNKGKKGQHRGRAWRINISETLSELEIALSIITQSSESHEDADNTEDTGGPENPERKGVYVDRLIRDTKLSEQVKKMYNYACQVCGTKIKTKKGFYCEGAHIKPLGSPHNGLDVLENILCLCPNHHVMLDYGVISINDDMTLLGIAEELTVVEGHNISPEYVAYHRENEFDSSIAKVS